MAKWGESMFEAGASLVAIGAVLAPAAHAETWTFEREHVLGASMGMAAHAMQEADAETAIAAAASEIARLDAVLSGWRGDSELAALNGAEMHEASSDLFAVIAQCEYWRQASFGAYCARQGAIEAVWRAAEREGREPEPGRLEELASLISADDVSLDVQTRRIARGRETRFAIDGLAKGYIIDAALDAARRAAPNVRGLLLEIGGDVRAWGESSDARGWSVGVAGAGHDNAAPRLIVNLRNKAIATSGAGARDRIIAGRAVSHLISPFTGWALEKPNRASVIADSAAAADALSTALSVLPPYEGLALIARAPGAEALIVDDQGANWASPGWRMETLSGELTCQAAAPATATPWPQNFAVQIRYEIPRIDGADYTRPYVVAWISDAERKLVRTLFVLGDRARWRQNNYVWQRRFERFTPDAVQAVSRPTRAPGRYDLIWDGLDNNGRAVGQGHYTLTIEAAREHGGHSIQVIDLDLGAAPLQQSAPAQPEIGAVSARYGARP